MAILVAKVLKAIHVQKSKKAAREKVKTVVEELRSIKLKEAAKMVEGMNVGEISKPFTMINAKGKEICAIVKLKTRLNGHKATITEDYQRLKGIVMEKRSEEKLDKWIKDKQKHTYVRINEKWQKCDFKYPGWVKK